MKITSNRAEDYLRHRHGNQQAGECDYHIANVLFYGLALPLEGKDFSTQPTIFSQGERAKTGNAGWMQNIDIVSSSTECRDSRLFSSVFHKFYCFFPTFRRLERVITDA